ncbi:MAG: hypothetical protein O2782_02325 [bacterium]|nr:hypothetical protein [bacterium]
MADATPPSKHPSPEDLSAISFLREDLQEIKRDLRDLRRIDLQEVRQELRVDLQDVRQDVRDLRGEIRHSMVISMGYTTILLGLLAAFMQYRLPAG